MSAGGDFEVGQSVGKSLETNVVLSVNHPFYQKMSESVAETVAELASSRAAARAAATLSVVTVSLASDDLATLAELFPEFRIANYGFSRPAHSMFVQARRFSCEWLLLQAGKLCSTVVCYGTPLIAAIESGFDDVTLVVDPVSVLSVHERHAADLDAWRIYADYVEVSKNVGQALSRVDYDKFLRRERVRFVSQWDNPPVGEVVCVDGFLNAYGPWQVAMAMVSAGAEVAFGFFPYHPSMLLNESGELPGFGVFYERTSDKVAFKYPDGVAGVTSYSIGAWRAWLVAHVFSVGSRNKTWFQLELLKHRGCVMFYRMVKLDSPPERVEIVHSLDLPSAQPMYVVSACRLKALGLNPDKASSWRTERYVVGQRLVDRVYQFAMQLPREQFTRYAIRKQLEVVNNRVTIEGTSVKVNSPLGEEMLDALVVDLFARAFVDRYDSGRLTDAVKKYVDTVVGFSTMGLAGRLWFVVVTCVLDVWDVTLGAVNRYARRAADAVRRFLSSGYRPEAPVIDVMPSYVLVGPQSLLRPDLEGGNLLAAEMSRRAAIDSVGMFSELVKTLAQLSGPVIDLGKSAFRVDSFALFSSEGAHGPVVDEAVGMMRALNPVDEAPEVRRFLEVTSATRQLDRERKMHFNPVADPVYVLNEFYSEVLPGVAEQDLEYDTASISLDPQDRSLAAPYLKLPRYFGDVPKSKSYYRSKLRALNVPKRQQTLQELLSAMAARNLNAPQVALPQDDKAMAITVWENFLNVACVPEARVLLETYRRDPVGLDETAFREWAEQSTPEKLLAVRRELEEQSQALGEMDVGSYLVMLKADVKPTLSKKPLDSRTEPQVIVYHEKALSALYSSIFRVLVRRFLALLKPNYHVNLLKDTKDMEAFVRGIHPYHAEGLRYLENDFSKYDKSQGKFVFVLEEYVFSQLGMNEEFLQQWLGGHVECRLRAVAMGLSLHVLYQRKSGDATTSFGNVLLNVLSVSYAYRGTDVIWALFMGDDSVACVRGVAHEADAVSILAEVFNLGAKTYLTDSPYFASNFILINPINQSVHFVPDPVKRIERWSMAISAEDPQWHERYVSACDSLAVYLNCAKTVLLPRLLAERYSVRAEGAKGVADAIATVLAAESAFRGMWEDEPTVSNY